MRLVARGERVGLAVVRLFRPVPERRAARGDPGQRARAIAVLDRTKEPGAAGEPLYQDVRDRVRRGGRDAPDAAHRRRALRARLEGVHARDGEGRLRRARRGERRATTSRSASATTSRTRACRGTATFSTEGEGVRALFYGLGSDGTVGAAKSTVTIIASETPLYAQGYFVYDSKKSGAVTISHVRFGAAADPLHATRSSEAEFVSVPPLRPARRGSTCSSAPRPARAVLLNSPHPRRAASGTQLPRDVQEQVLDEAARALGDRRRPRRARGRHGRPHQHRDAALLLRAVGRAAARARARGDPALDREDLREARPGGGRAQSRRGRSRARRAAPRRDARRRATLRRRAARASCPRRRPTSCSA